MKIVIGIDEVGRGPLAGPVVVSALCIRNEKAFKKSVKGFFLRDSKKLSEYQREKWFRVIQEMQKKGIVCYSISHVSPKIIDRLNITASANRAATHALTKLIEKLKINPLRCLVLLDGGLFLEKKNKKTSSVHTSTIIKGDEKIPAISLASIVAKVTRDRYMKNLDRKFPGYGFAQHKGYGTEEHRRALRRKGPSTHHRLTFIRNFTTIK